MKKSISWIIAVFMLLMLPACGGAPAQSSEQLPPDLTGVWKQTNSNAEEVYHEAEIQGDTIEIYWVDLESDTRALYWAGSFAAPETAEEPYSWESENDREKTDLALMSSTEDTKTFTYKDGQISYDMSIMGVDQTVVMEKQEDAVP